MSILVNKDSKIIVQGITGSEGQFHAGQMLEYGTQVVAGVTPGKGGQQTLDNRVPVFNSVEEAVEQTAADTSIIFVPPPFAGEAVIEASYAGIKVVVCITEGVPVHDMVKVKKVVDQNGTRRLSSNESNHRFRHIIFCPARCFNFHLAANFSDDNNSFCLWIRFK